MAIGNRVQGVLLIITGMLVTTALYAIGAYYPSHAKTLTDLAPVLTVPLMVIGVLKIMRAL